MIENYDTIRYKEIIADNSVTSFKNAVGAYLENYDDTFTLSDDVLKTVSSLLYNNFANCLIRYETKEIFLWHLAERLATYFNDFRNAVQLHNNIGTSYHLDDLVNDVFTESGTASKTNSKTVTSTDRSTSQNASDVDSKEASNPQASGVAPIDNYYDSLGKSITSDTGSNTNEGSRSYGGNETGENEISHINKGDIMKRIRSFYKLIGAPYPNFIDEFKNLFIQYEDDDFIYWEEKYLNEK